MCALQIFIFIIIIIIILIVIIVYNHQAQKLQAYVDSLIWWFYFADWGGGGVGITPSTPPLTTAPIKKHYHLLHNITLLEKIKSIYTLCSKPYCTFDNSCYMFKYIKSSPHFFLKGTVSSRSTGRGIRVLVCSD